MAAETTDHYAVLGVARDATEDEIKKAFRKRARECHPDVAGHDGAEDEFKQVNEAYEVLSDPEKRSMYDRFGTTDPRNVGFGGGGFDMSDVFDLGDVFSSFFGGGGGGAVRTEGRDMAHQVVVTLEEAAHGASKEIDVVRDAPCAPCGGRGAGEGGTVTTCPDCGGGGRVRSGRRTFLGMVETVTPCVRCAGTGSTVTVPCTECGGSGRSRRSERVTIDIPAGVPDGTTLRVRGMGEAGLRGSAAGDLLVTVRIAEHEFLHRQGDDLHERLGVSIAQAALGDTIEVDGLDGVEEVRVPAGSQHGDSVRLKGRGMPRFRGGGRGDLYIHLAVEVPRKLSKRQRELLKELGETLGQEREGTLHRLKDWLTG